jgi:hypothetical protein
VRLQALSEAQITAEFPDGGYESALAAAMENYQTLTARAQGALTRQQDSLMQLTGGRPISDSDLAALHRMLGL